VQQVKDALALLDLQICPHMTASDPTTIERIVGDFGEIMTEDRLSKRIAVECNTCETTFSIRTRIPSREIAVEVERRLGRVMREGDPIWRAHIPKREDALSCSRGYLFLATTKEHLIYLQSEPCESFPNQEYDVAVNNNINFVYVASGRAGPLYGLDGSMAGWFSVPVVGFSAGS
jgi:hypothetical protein